MDPDTFEWTWWKASGDIPSARSRPVCLFNETSHTLHVYGGVGRTLSSDELLNVVQPPWDAHLTDGMYSLDLDTMTWTHSNVSAPHSLALSGGSPTYNPSDDSFYLVSALTVNASFVSQAPSVWRLGPSLREWELVSDGLSSPTTRIFPTVTVWENALYMHGGSKTSNTPPRQALLRMSLSGGGPFVWETVASQVLVYTRDVSACESGDTSTSPYLGALHAGSVLNASSGVWTIVMGIRFGVPFPEVVEIDLKLATNSSHSGAIGTQFTWSILLEYGRLLREPLARGEHITVQHPSSGKIYVATGVGEDGLFKSAFAWLPAEQRWQRFSSMDVYPTCRRNHVCEEYNATTIICGFGKMDQSAINDLFFYNHETRRWSLLWGSRDVNPLLGEEPLLRDEPCFAYHAPTDTLYMYGGDSLVQQLVTPQVMWKFHVATRTWTSLYSAEPSVWPLGRLSHDCVFLPGGDSFVMVAGQYDGGGHPNDVWEFNVLSEEWTLLAEIENNTESGLVQAIGESGSIDLEELFLVIVEGVVYGPAEILPWIVTYNLTSRVPSSFMVTRDSSQPSYEGSWDAALSEIPTMYRAAISYNRGQVDVFDFVDGSVSVYAYEDVAGTPLPSGTVPFWPRTRSGQAVVGDAVLVWGGYTHENVHGYLGDMWELTMSAFCDGEVEVTVSDAEPVGILNSNNGPVPTRSNTTCSYLIRDEQQLNLSLAVDSITLRAPGEKLLVYGGESADPANLLVEVTADSSVYADVQNSGTSVLVSAAAGHTSLYVVYTVPASEDEGVVGGGFTATSGTRCDVGTVPSASRGACEPCAVGKRGVVVDNTNVCVDCAPGTYQAEVGQTQCRVCQAGWFTLDTKSCIPCPRGLFSSNNASDSCESCQTRAFSSSEGATQCEECPPNMWTQQRGSTSIDACACEPSYWLPPQRPHADGCVPCSAGASCSGGSDLPVATAGFFLDMQKLAVVQCVPEEACAHNNTCAEGYMGNGCLECAPGYTRWRRGECIQCPSSSLSLTAFLGMILVGVAVVCLVVYLWAHRYFGKHPAGRGSSTIFVDYMQVLYTFSLLQVRWPRLQRPSFWVSSAITLQVSELFVPSCTVHYSYYHGLAWRLSIPIVVVAITTAFFVVLHSILYCVERTNLSHSDFLKFNWADRRRHYMAIVVFFLYILYTSLVTTALEMFSCGRHEDGRWFLRAEPSLTCYGDEWWRYSPIGIAGVTLYGLGIPVLFAVTFFWNGDPDDIVISRLTLQFKRPFYAWVLTLLTRRLVIVLVITFGVDDLSASSVVLLPVLAVVPVLEAYLQPFYTPSNNTLSVFVNSSEFLMLLMGLFYFSDLANDQTERTTEAVKVFLLALVCLTFLAQLHRMFFEFCIKRKNTMGRPPRVRPSSSAQSLAPPVRSGHARTSTGSSALPTAATAAVPLLPVRRQE